MKALLTARSAYQLYAEVAISSLMAYFFSRAVPVPNRTYFIVVGAVDAVVRGAIVMLAKEIAQLLAKQKESRVGRSLTKDPKAEYTLLCTSIAAPMICLLPIVYSRIGKAIKLQLPDYPTTFACFALADAAMYSIIGMSRYLVPRNSPST